MASKLTKSDVLIIDLGDVNPNTEEMRVKQRDLLIENHKTRHTEGMSSWFFPAMLRRDANDTIIAVDVNDNQRQLGYLQARKDDETNAQHVHDIESFVPRQGVATILLDYLSMRNNAEEKFKILVVEPMPDSLPFWEKYFKHNPTAGMLDWWTSGGSGPGPYLTLNEGVILYCEFVTLIDHMKKAFNAIDVRPMNRSSGGILIEGINHIENQDLEICFPVMSFKWPWIRATWREEWSSDENIFIVSHGFQTTFSFSNRSQKFDLENLETLKQCFEAVQIKMDFIL